MVTRQGAAANLKEPDMNTTTTTATARWNALFSTAIDTLEYGTEAYFITSGTGEGVFAYEASAFERGLDAAEAAAEERYTAFCDATVPETDEALARHIYGELGLQICVGGSCTRVIDFDEEKDDDGYASVRTYWEIQIDRHDGSGWTNEALAETPDANQFDSEDEAESEIPELARCLECDPGDLRVEQVFGEPDFDDVEQGLRPGIYSAYYLNPPSGIDCTHLLVRADGSLGWCDQWGDQVEDSQGHVSRFSAEELCSDN